ncbi:PLP-dependent aminotransferase family protein [Kerstersia similis]|uniref:MocR-like pyridoxine biosynthesis transcription factor PdxR n=1 Tax=Kerstersia similis TaxID=206505 RepID=UPI0039EE4ADE
MILARVFPVTLPFLTSLIVLLSDYLLQYLDYDKLSPRGPLNRQIYDLLRQAILKGMWPPNMRMPSTRALADELKLSRNTVLHAFEQLLAEGYLISRAGSGTYLSDTLPGHVPDRLLVAGETRPAPDPGLSRRGLLVLKDAAIVESPSGAFALGVSDTDHFPHAAWARMIGRHWRYCRCDKLNYAHHGGYYPLRQAVAEHLRLSRSVNCTPEQVIITTSIQQSIALVSQMLADTGDRVWVEEPGYRPARSLLQAQGLELVPVPVDAEGLTLQGELMLHPPHLIYVTPSHQFPLGMVMSLARRRRLLEYVRQHDAWVLEDDYDSEFRFEGRVLASLQGLDEHGRVIYMGSLSKTLFPGIRTGYVVLPEAIAAQCADGYAELFRDGQLVQQAALAEFISQGMYAAHIRRMRQLYARKQTLLRAAIAKRLGQGWPVSAHEAGLHLVLHLPADCRPGTDQDIVLQARRQGLVARALSSHYAGSSIPSQGLLLGYAGVQESQIVPAFERLARIIEQTLSVRRETAPA